MKRSVIPILLNVDVGHMLYETIFIIFKDPYFI